VKAKLIGILTPALAWGLNLACPLIPAFVWSALITAVVNGDVTLDHITEFLASHNIKTYHEASDFPSGVNGQTTPPVVSKQGWRNNG
jgi:hypothetical protein